MPIEELVKETSREKYDTQDDLFDFLIGSHLREEKKRKETFRREREAIHKEILKSIDDAILRQRNAILCQRAWRTPYSTSIIEDRSQVHRARIESLEKERRLELLRFWKEMNRGSLEASEFDEAEE